MRMGGANNSLRHQSRIIGARFGKDPLRAEGQVTSPISFISKYGSWHIELPCPPCYFFWQNPPTEEFQHYNLSYQTVNRRPTFLWRIWCYWRPSLTRLLPLLLCLATELDHKLWSELFPSPNDLINFSNIPLERILPIGSAKYWW